MKVKAKIKNQKSKIKKLKPNDKTQMSNEIQM